MNYEWPNVAWSAPPVWKGDTFTIVGNGPSLDPLEVAEAAQTTRMIAINSSFKAAPFADVLFGCDAKFWNENPTAYDFTGLRVGLAWDGINQKYHKGWNELDPFKIKFMGSSGEDGLELADPRMLRIGRNSGFQAINLAIHLGATRIILLGYDMRAIEGVENYGGHKMKPWRTTPVHPFHLFIPPFETIVEPLKSLGVEIINCTMGSALKSFQIKPLGEVL